MNVLADELKKALSGEVSDSPKDLEAASRDASLFRVTPEVVVYPKDASDLEKLVAFVSEKKQVPKANISITMRSAGTDMSGGPLNTSIIADTTRHLNHIIEVSETSAIVEPGVYFRDFDRETKKKGVELPSYTASRELNTVGGMVANNSGGEKNLKYGKTARYVEELDVVLADGKVHTLKKLAGEALQNKLAEQSFEGDIYRKVAALVGTPLHQKVIQDAAPKVEKNSSGYALWDIGNGTDSLNLARLMVGAQGTLGIISRIKVSLVKPKAFSAMTVIFVNSLSELGAIVPEALKAKPDSFESYDDHTFKIAVKYFPEFALQMKAGIVSLGLSFLPEVLMMLTGGVPKLVLMIEFRADTQAEALKNAQDFAAHIKALHGRAKVRVCKDEKASRKYWVVRHESFNLLRKKVRGKRTAPFIDEIGRASCRERV